MKETENSSNIKKERFRIGKYLHEVTVVTDAAGNVLQKITKPLMVEFYPRDVVQIIVGATLLAIPVAFTEELWNLAEVLPLINIIALSLISLLFIGIFTYHNYYQNNAAGHKGEFLKRILTTYILSLLVVALILFLIQKGPWSTDWLLALRRVLLVGFPASMSAAVADLVK